MYFATSKRMYAHGAKTPAGKIYCSIIVRSTEKYVTPKTTTEHSHICDMDMSTGE